jgi:hypothetical protein
MSDSKYQTTALKRAARGLLKDQTNGSDRAKSVYGFKNSALQLTGEQLRDAWKVASLSVKSKG